MVYTNFTLYGAITKGTYTISSPSIFYTSRHSFPKDPNYITLPLGPQNHAKNMYVYLHQEPYPLQLRFSCMCPTILTYTDQDIEEAIAQA